MMKFDDKETNVLWGKLITHYNQWAPEGHTVNEEWLLKHIMQNEIDAWNEG